MTGLDPPQLLAALRLEGGRTLVLSRASLPGGGLSHRGWLTALGEQVLLVP